MEEEKMELMHRRCCGLDVHKETVVACLRLVSDGQVTTEVRTFQTTTADLLRLSKWLPENECTHVAMEATGIYWGPGTGFDLVPRSPLNVVQMPANANSGRSSVSANHTTSFFFVSGFGSGAYSAKLLAGTKQRFSGLSQPG
jgi:hypothetical protein